MEVLFENCYVVTKERYTDWVKHPIKKNYFNLFWILLMVFSIALFVVSILEGELILAAIYFGFLLFFVYRMFFRVRLISAKAYKIISDNQGIDRWERCVQFTDCITVVDGNVTVKYHWNQISRLQDNTEYIILVFKNNTGIRLDKKGFTKGTYDEFVQYAHQQISTNAMLVG